ncbi:PilN domain-containing protein [Denitrificimonas sp. JX-1]|uniref:PilN domain-containing protein n=1 Tax=Denitrificimonas halotolerans TaxID=3098930 RepID=A0ABU5GNL7_9GAMM|nr:PilN domain-containing protein [Denitrificimonas sp. JX-1]MDY7218587.1 PilN domain-containing protein [Denitrificimonas sp. JX-1]
MPGINLLPWREQQRAERQRRFFTVLILVLILATVVVFLLEYCLHVRVQQQLARNALIRDEISGLNVQVAQVRELQARREQLLDRLTRLHKLQSDRASIVRLLEQLARTVPEGMGLTALKVQGERLLISGKARSNALVSRFMLNQRGSDWLSEPTLEEVKVIQNGHLEPVYWFRLSMEKWKFNDHVK